MGYFKNQLIAEQVELGDRVPAPKPAWHHVAWDTRRGRLAWEAAGRRALRRAVGHWFAGGFFGILIGFIAGVMMGVEL